MFKTMLVQIVMIQKLYPHYSVLVGSRNRF